MNIRWKNWCWSWSSDTLATWCEELIHWKRPWCWGKLKAGEEGANRGWDGWMASPTQWTWVSKLWERVNREAWFAAVHGVAKSQTHDWVTERQWEQQQQQQQQQQHTHTHTHTHIGRLGAKKTCSSSETQTWPVWGGGNKNFILCSRLKFQY